jgi:multidrug efflux pump subunit AcrB
LSWLLAVTVTPLLGVMLLKSSGDQASDPYDRAFFRLYRRFLAGAVRRRWVTLGVMTILLFTAVFGFGYVKQSFFPDSTRPQFFIDFWRPEGTHISDTARDVQQVSSWLHEQEGVEAVTSFVGQGGLRFMLTYEPQLPSSAYGQLLVTVDDSKRIDELQTHAIDWLAANFPDAEPKTRRFVFGTGAGAKIEARFSGKDPEVLRGLAGQAKAVMRGDPNAKDVRDDWRQRVPVIRPVYAETQARNASVSRRDLADSLQIATTGSTVGLYREAGTLMPIVFRLAEADRSSIEQLDNAQVWSSSTGRAVPVSQVVSGLTTAWEDPLIRRQNRRRTITVQCDPREGVANPVFQRVRPAIEAVELPPGYELEWGGEYESSNDANRMLMASVPLFFSLMILIVVALFNTLRQTLIVFLTLPLAIIGVAAGLLLTGQPFGFVALLGFLSLSGMLIKNAVVLLDQIDINLERGQRAIDAVLDAGVSRVRPVTMASFSTVLGMTPLLFDRFWAAMAVTIMAGLAFATVLTLVVVPVLYATFYRVASTSEPEPQRNES